MKNFVEYCKANEGKLVGGKLDGEDLICFDDMQKYWDEYVIFFMPVVGSSLPNRNTVISEIKNNLKEINEDKKVTNIDFDLGYSLGFFDGFDFNK